MRQIKFRAWRAEAGHMHPHVGVFPTTCKCPWSISSDGIMVNPLMGDKFILMQFTGLHDKNGKEIYEGDIVRDQRPCGEIYISQVLWDETAAMYIISDPDETLTFADIHPAWLEVIGNIHENPELLEGERQ